MPPSRTTQVISLAKITTLPLVLLLVLFYLRYTPAPLPRSQQLLSKLSELNAGYSVLEDKVVYSNFARVYARTVRYSDGTNFTFDVWGRTWRDNSFGVAIAIPFTRTGRRTGSFTLVREYCVAHARFVYSFPAGQVELKKHADARAGAVAELGEEAGLKCTRPMVSLLGTDGGAPQDKFQREAVHYFLCTDARRDRARHDRDKEERIQVVPDVSVKDLMALVRAGAMQSNMIAAALMAVEELRRSRLL